jgi:nucleoside-diphosphate-sugar epimerase
MRDSVDVVLLSANRLIRAPLRAQLIEDGFEVIGTDTWTRMRQHLRTGEKPLVAIVDLQNLPDAGDLLLDLRLLMQPSHVIVLAAPASPALDLEDVVRLGYVVLRRPMSIGQIVDAARALRNRLASAPERSAKTSAERSPT